MKLSNLLNEFKKYRNDYIISIKNEKNFKKKIIKRIPNILTKSRFIAPFIIVPISFYSLNIALITSVLFALTDAFDGYVARKYDAHSEYGRILDTICDKVFAIGISIPILLINPILIITILLECVIAIINFNSSLKNNNPKSTYLGKFKTCLLSFNLILNYLGKINLPLNLLTNFVQLTTAVDYYKIDKNKDKLKKEVILDKQPNEEVINNDIQREKNELLELKKSLLNNEIEKDKQLIKKM